MTGIATAVAHSLLTAAAVFQAALALGAPWGRYAYGGRAAREDGRLPGRFRAASGCTVGVLGAAAWCAHAGTTPWPWVFAALFALNTAANLTATHPAERWGMSAATLTLAAAFVTLGMA